jgi:toxin ParE1/3/4
MEIVLLLAADQDLQAAYEWVSRYREGRGNEFLADLDKGLDYLRQYPRVGKVHRGRYRRLLIPKYPFGIFYVVATDRFVVHAILDLRQDPKIIERRFRSSED